MTNGAATGNEVQTRSYNPWHHMKGVQKHLRIPGTILPKRLMRPYFYDHPYRIDDKQYVIASISSLKDGLHFVYGSLYMIAGGGGFSWLGCTRRFSTVVLHFNYCISGRPTTTQVRQNAQAQPF